VPERRKFSPRRDDVQKLPSIGTVGTDPSTVDVMRVPCPDRIENVWAKIQRSFQRRRVMKA
jgi:hypothetical protein